MLIDYLNFLEFFETLIVSSVIENKHTHSKLPIPLSLKRLLDNTDMKLKNYLTKINAFNPAEMTFI